MRTLEKRALAMEDTASTWPEPEPLPDDLSPVRTLDPAMIPEPLRDWLLDISERMQVPLDYSAAGVVVALSALVGRKIGIRPKRHDDWHVVPNLWGAVVGRPAMMKSPAIQQAIKPLSRLIAEAMENYEHGKRDFMFRKEKAEARRKARKKELEKAAQKGEDLKRFDNDIIEDPQPPVLRRYMTQDGTVAAIGQLLLDNPNGLLVLRDELVGWLKTLDREGNEGDRAFYLESWNGQGSFTVDRIGRGTLHVPAITLSIFGGIQPGILKDYVYAAHKGGMGDDGLIQRFQLLVWPDPSGAWKDIDRWPDSTAKSRVFEIFQTLDTLVPWTMGATTDGEVESIPHLRFAGEAQALFNEWRSELEMRLRDGSIQNPALESHLAKYRSLFPSLALIFHLVDVADGAMPGPVSLKATTMAAAWCEYLESHAQRLYASIGDPALESARVLLTRLKAGDVKLSNGSFRARDIYLKGWSRLATPAEATAAINLLAELGWVSTAKMDNTGGRPVVLVYPHPCLIQGGDNRR